ncbi:hypothetical protein EVG20_g5462 [Dentipellis fragilis]|uniref:Serine aminopeptidase S33 domain-containing protein n=1 Tax=Dentipellis fragilis TaxID=205917 RepID=A0A4Y9YT79_9AGAM|nr:hypothetical protein EVG20_g5462 [Dentipellis fragilis]
MTKYDVEIVKVPSATKGWNLDVSKYLPLGASSSKPVPVIVMAHGLASTKGMGLSVYADKFASLGYACLVFDYRYWGASDGAPRHIVSTAMQHEDYRTVVKWARQQAEFDPNRLVLWGTSYAGGHVVSISGEPRVNPCATIAQCPYLGATEAARPHINMVFAQLLLFAIIDVVRQFFGWSPLYVPAAGPPGTPAIMMGEKYVEQIKELEVEPGSWPNEVAANVLFDVTTYHPASIMMKSRTPAPLLIVAPAKDVLCHIEKAREVVKAADLGEIKELEGATHFEVYPKKPFFEPSLTAQIEFLKKHVPV